MQHGNDQDRQGGQQDDSLIGRDERSQQQNQQSGQFDAGHEMAEGDDDMAASETGQGDYGSAGEMSGGLTGETGMDDDEEMMSDGDDLLGGSSDSDR